MIVRRHRSRGAYFGQSRLEAAPTGRLVGPASCRDQSRLEAAPTGRLVGPASCRDQSRLQAAPAMVGLSRMKLLRTFFLLPLLLAVACSESGPAISASAVQVIASPPGRTASVAYLTLTNNSKRSITIDAVSSPHFGRAEMHETVLENGIARMNAISEVEIAAKSEIRFAPGAKHIMLFDPLKALIPGKQVSLHIHLSSGELLMLDAPISARLATE